MRVFTKLPSFEFRSKFSTWVFAVARNAGIDAIRTRGRADRLAQRAARDSSWRFPLRRFVPFRRASRGICRRTTPPRDLSHEQTRNDRPRGWLDRGSGLPPRRSNRACRGTCRRAPSPGHGRAPSSRARG
ncbi:MAG: hypothetical protein ACRD1T_06470 [Acidimicrobiia bacterium]